MFTIMELYFVFALMILLYIAFAVSKDYTLKDGNKKSKKGENYLQYVSHISSRTSILVLLMFLIIVAGVIWFFVTKPEEAKIEIDSGKTYVKKFYTGFTNNVKVFVHPLSGSASVDLLYGNEKNGDKIRQCQWVAKSDDLQTNTFVNDALGSYYELRVVPTQKTEVLINIVRGNNMTVYQTPMNATTAPINASHSRIVEIVPEGSSYNENQKSSTYDFGNSLATNIEIFASCSNATAPKMSLFGSDVNEDDNFIRITEFSFIDGTFTSLNSKYYVDNVALTHHRYFYIQITDSNAVDLYVKIVRRNY